MRILKVGVVIDLSVIELDVKLNLQETDYGNFLGDEVCFMVLIVSLPQFFPARFVDVLSRSLQVNGRL